MPGPPTVFLSVGEASGDRYAGPLAGEIRRRAPGCRLLGLGGPRMEAAGVERLAGLDETAVMGLVEVARRLPTLLRVRSEARRRLVREDVDLLVAVDYPGFNLPLCRFAARRGIRVLYLAPPQVWAWRPGRARAVAERCDLVCTVLPFAAEPFARAGAEVEFVGHPLVDQVEAEGEPDFGPAGAEGPTLGLFPGSREQEVRALLPPMADAARRLARGRPELRTLVARAPDVSASAYRSASDLEAGRAGEVAARSTAALAASGTVTLELALHGTPMVVAYRTNPLTWAAARRLVRVEHVSLVNLAHGSRLVPELLQGRVTAASLSRAVAPLLDGGPRRRRTMRGLREVREKLGRPGVASRVARRCLRLTRAGRSAA